MTKMDAIDFVLAYEISKGGAAYEMLHDGYGDDIAAYKEEYRGDYTAASCEDGYIVSHVAGAGYFVDSWGNVERATDIFYIVDADTWSEFVSDYSPAEGFTTTTHKEDAHYFTCDEAIAALSDEPCVSAVSFGLTAVRCSMVR